jgi:hypothetical protein
MILVAGDSFVYGSELADTGKTFAKLLAQQYEDISWPGYSNDAIARTTIERCQQGGITAVVVSWTFPGRYEFRFDYDTQQKNSPWYSINSWTIENFENIAKEYIKKDKKIYFDQIQNIKRANFTGVKQFAEVFYHHVGATEYWEIYSSLKEIVYLQNYLKLKRIPYMFTCADTYILNNHNTPLDITLASLFGQIDFDKWYLFPEGAEWETTTLRGFYQWAVENKYPMGTTHPLEQAHSDAAQLMQEKFNELVKKSIQ